MGFTFLILSCIFTGLGIYLVIQAKNIKIEKDQQQIQLY
jgi:hypothetical protein